MLSRRSPRTSVAWVVAAVLVVTGTLLAASDLATLHRRARESGRRASAVVAGRDLPLGAVIEEDDVEQVTWFEGALPPRPIGSRRSATGRVVTTPVLEGSVLTERHLAPRSRSGLDGVVPPGMRAVEVVIENLAGARPGSVVDVLVTFDPASAPTEVEPTTTVVEGALVVRVGGRDEDATSGPSSVTVLVDPDGARRLAFAEASGIVTLALAPPEESCCPKPSSTQSSDSSRG